MSPSTDANAALAGGNDQAVHGEWLTRALLLDPVAIPGGAACFADARPLGLTRLPILLGWRRAGGSLVVGASSGTAGPALLAAAEAVAAATAEWTDARWDAAFRAFWKVAEARLREELAERLPLPPSTEWSLESWSATVWGAYSGGVEPGALAVVGASVPDEVREGVRELRRHVRAAAFIVEPLDEYGHRIRCSLVAGELDPIPERILPGQIDVVEPSLQSGRPRVLEEVLPAVERVAAESGARPTWSRRDWVRFEGPRGAVRVFPTGEGVWVQLVGADEGARTGLWYRHGLPPDSGEGAPSDPPPGAHLFLRDAEALTRPVESLLRHWLRGPDVEAGEG